jgi:hypothetical protein
MSKRRTILALFEQRVLPNRIINDATNPPADLDYQRRLRHWAADCASRSIQLLRSSPIEHEFATAALAAARGLATQALSVPPMLIDYNSLFDEIKRTASSPTAEAKLAAALSCHPNVFVGSLGASTHARRAIQNSSLHNTPRSRETADAKELRWHATRLKAWLQDDEPEPLVTA